MKLRSVLANVFKQQPNLSPVDNRGGWLSLWGTVKEAFSGAWQRNIEQHRSSVLHYSPVFACITLIASDISKIEWCMRTFDETAQIWRKTPKQKSSPYLTVLRRPNNYQNQNQFRECWALSKLQHGNSYGLIVRDLRGMVKQIYILDPTHVTPLVTPEGEVFYQLSPDNMTGGLLGNGVTVPASEIIHDRYNCLFHPLVGLSPIFACALPALLGIRAQENYYQFFGNGARPSGVLTAPGQISKETAESLKKQFDEGFTGANAGRTAVLGDGLKYEKMSSTAVESALIDQLEMSEKQICAVFHVPLYKIGAEPTPARESVEAQAQEYVSTTLQKYIEDMEAVFNDALGLDDTTWLHLDIKNLLRMDTASQMSTLKEGVGAAIIAPDEARRELDMPPVPGGKYPLAQQQNYSLEALGKRDAKDDPFSSGSGSSTTPPNNTPDGDATGDGSNDNPTNDNEGEASSQDEQRSAEFFTKAFEHLELELADEA